jgi:hypothetical protein
MEGEPSDFIAVDFTNIKYANIDFSLPGWKQKINDMDDNEFDRMMEKDEFELLRYHLNDLHSSLRSIKENNELVADTAEKKAALMRLKDMDKERILSAINGYMWGWDSPPNHDGEQIETLVEIAESIIIFNLRGTPMKDWTLDDYTLLKGRGLYP